MKNVKKVLSIKKNIKNSKGKVVTKKNKKIYVTEFLGLLEEVLLLLQENPEKEFEQENLDLIAGLRLYVNKMLDLLALGATKNQQSKKIQNILISHLKKLGKLDDQWKSKTFRSVLKQKPSKEKVVKTK